MAPHHRRGAQRRLDVVDREHEQLRLARLGRLQQLQARSVAVVHLAAEAAHEVDLLVGQLERGERDAAHVEHARDDLPEAPVAGDDHRLARVVDRVELGRRGALAPGGEQPVVQREHERRDHHRQRHREHQPLGDRAGEHAEAGRRAEQHEGELAALRDRVAHRERARPGRAHRARDQRHERELDRHQAEREPEHRERLAARAGRGSRSCPRR